MKKYIIIGLLLLGVNSVSWAEDDELVLYCIDKKRAYVVDTRVISRESWPETTHTFKIIGETITDEEGYRYQITARGSSDTFAERFVDIETDMGRYGLHFKIEESGKYFFWRTWEDSISGMSAGTCTKF
tara:strand:- start:489 stop:875 length:387 start_codon:yes stop_codon:yes gene_type:complete